MKQIDNIEMTEEFLEEIKVFLTDDSFEECFLLKIKEHEIALHTTQIVSLIHKLTVAYLHWMNISSTEVMNIFEELHHD